MINNTITKLLEGVRENVQAETKVYLPLLPTSEIPPQNWLINDFIPTLVFLPSAVADSNVADFEREMDVAFALELSYIGHLVHSFSPKFGSGADYRMAILVGDYFSSKAAGKLSTEQFIQWSADVGKVICDLSRGVFQGLNGKSANCPNDNVGFTQVYENLQLANGNIAALAAKMAVETLPMSDFEKSTYIEFATLAGVLQGMKVNGFDLIYPLEFANLENDCLKILVSLPKFEATAKALILEKIMESNGLIDERNVGEGEKQASSEASFKAI